MTWKPDAVPFPDLSIMLGYGTPASVASPVAAAAGATSKLVLTEVHEADDELGYLAEIIVVDNQLVIVGGTYHKSTVLVSSNAVAYARREALSSGLRAVTAVDGGILKVGEYGLAAFSADVGRTWTKQATGTSGCLFGVTVLGGVPWICGDEGYLARWDGTAWHKVDSQTKTRLSDVITVGEQLYLLGFDGVVRVLRDGRPSETIVVGASKPLTSLCRTRTGAFILTGDGGFVARSGDGRAFTRVEIKDVRVDLEAVTQLASGTLVIVGDDGLVLTSDDDGLSWRPLHGIDDGMHLWCVTAFGPGALIGGDDGAIWKLAPAGDKTWADRPDVFAADDDTDLDEDDDGDDDEDDDDEDDDDEGAGSAVTASSPDRTTLDRSVDELELSVRTANCLQTAEIRFVGELVQKTELDLLRSKNFGAKSLKEIKEILAEMELHLGMDLGGWSPPATDQAGR